jgi:hypothetical protein
MHGNACSVILADLLQTVCVDDCSIVSVREEVWHLRQLWTQSAHGLYGYQPKKKPYIYNRSWETRAARSSCNIAREFGLSQSRLHEVLFATSCIHSTTRGAHICFQTIVFYGYYFSNGCIMFRTSSVYQQFLSILSAFYAWRCLHRPQRSRLGTGNPNVNLTWASVLGWHRWAHCRDHISACWH